MKTNIILAAAVAAIVSLSGCANGGPTNRQLGIGTGAVLGGAAAGALVGNEVTKRR